MSCSCAFTLQLRKTFVHFAAAVQIKRYLKQDENEVNSDEEPNYNFNSYFDAKISRNVAKHGSESSAVYLNVNVQLKYFVPKISE